MSNGTLAGKTVLATGAGCLGKRLIRRLHADAPAEIRVFDMSRDALDSLEPPVTAIVGDITDRAALDAALAGVDIVIHTAAVLEGNDPDLYYRVNQQGARTVAEAAAAAGVDRMVHISSSAVYGFVTGDVFEDDGPNPTAQAYSRSKAFGEEAVKQVHEATGLSYSIVRPAAIFGPGARYFSGTYMQRATKKPILGMGRGTIIVTFVDDVADMAVVAATHPGAENEIFNCAVDPAPLHKEYLHAYGRLVDNTSWLPLPMSLISMLTWVVVPFQKKDTYGRQLPQNLRQLNRTFRLRMDKARERLDWAPAHDVAAGVEASIPWLKEQGFLDEDAS